jgi:hypothetical protein
LFYRYGNANKAAAALDNGLLKDLGFIDDNDLTDVLDANTGQKGLVNVLLAPKS